MKRYGYYERTVDLRGFLQAVPYVLPPGSRIIAVLGSQGQTHRVLIEAEIQSKPDVETR